MLSTPCRPLQRPAPPPPAAARRGRGIGLLASICCGTVAAQVSTQSPPERSISSPAGRDTALAAAQPYEVTVLRSRVLALPVALPQAGRGAPNDLAALTYRVWSSLGRADVGIGVGTVGYLVRSPEVGAGPEGTHALVGVVPAVTMGMRIRITDEHALFADAYRAHGLAADAAAAGYGTKVGVEWRPAKATFGLERGAFGMQLESGYRLSLKVRHGGPSLYLRGQF